MKTSRRRAWRALLSALAGGGLTAAGLGGPLAGGVGSASAAISLPSSAPAGPSNPEAPETAPEQPANTSSTPSPPPAGPSHGSTGPEVAGGGQSSGSGGGSETPAVALQHKQQSTSTRSEAPAVTTTKAKPKATKKPAAKAPKTAGGPNGVALPPQLVAGQSGALSAQLAFSAASSQALAFFRIPLFLLPIYQAAAAQYGVPWQILAAINEVETDFGRDQSVSSAGAVGWMQFMPATWLSYGVDALNAGYADPYNPVDAIFAAARYLQAAGAQKNLRAAILAYNHSEEYVDSVMLRAKLISAYPASVIATLTGLVDDRLPLTGTEVLSGPLSSAELPAPSSATANAVSQAPAAGASATASAVSGPQAPLAAPQSSGSSATPGATSPLSPTAAAAAGTSIRSVGRGSQLVELLSAPNAAVVAVQDGQIVKLGDSHALGKYLVLRDIYGDVFTYAGLGSIAPTYSPPKAPQTPHAPVTGPLAEASANAKPSPSQPAGAGSQPVTLHVRAPAPHAAPAPVPAAPEPIPTAPSETAPAGMGRVRLFAHPGNPDALAARSATHAQAASRSARSGRLPLRRGAVVAEGTVLGHVLVPAGAKDGHMRFAIRPAGDPSTIDPRTIVANWEKLKAALHPQGATGEPQLLGATVGEVLLMSKSQLERAVLTDPGIAMSACSRHEVASGAIDTRVLTVLAFLSRSGLKPSVGTLRCAHDAYDVSGYVPTDHLGDAVAISQVNGLPVAGHQGAGSITDTMIRTLLTLPGRLSPHLIVSLMQYPGVPKTVARADHGDYVEIVFTPHAGKPAPSAKPTAAGAAAAHSAGPGPTAPAPETLGGELTGSQGGELTGSQWDLLISRIAALPAPTIASKPTASAIPDPKTP